MLGLCRGLFVDDYLLIQIFFFLYSCRSLLKIVDIFQIGRKNRRTILSRTRYLLDIKQTKSYLLQRYITRYIINSLNPLQFKESRFSRPPSVAGGLAIPSIHLFYIFRCVQIHCQLSIRFSMCGVMVSTRNCESSYPSSTLGEL